MNWFNDIFSDYVLTGVKMDFDYGFFLVVSFTILLATLLFRKSVGWRGIIVALFLGYIIDFIKPHPRLILSQFESLHYLIGNLTFQTSSIVLGFTLSTLVLLMCLFSRRFRNLHRISFGVATFMMCFLAYTYHVVVINGSLNATLEMEGLDAQIVAESIHEHSSSEFRQQCLGGGFRCYSGSVDELDNPPVNSFIQSHFDDFYSHYSAHSDEFSFSISRGLVDTDTPFVLGFAQKGGEYRMALSKERVTNWVNIHTVVLGFFFTAAQYFWAIGSMVVIYAHQMMFRNRSIRSKKEKDTDTWITPQSQPDFNDGCDPDDVIDPIKVLSRR